MQLVQKIQHAHEIQHVRCRSTRLSRREHVEGDVVDEGSDQLVLLTESNPLIKVNMKLRKRLGYMGGKEATMH